MSDPLLTCRVCKQHYYESEGCHEERWDNMADTIEELRAKLACSEELVAKLYSRLDEAEADRDKGLVVIKAAREYFNVPQTLGKEVALHAALKEWEER